MLSLWRGHCWDNARGGWLDPAICTRSQEAVAYIRHHVVDSRAPTAKTGKAPVRTGWIETDLNKRQQWFATDFKTDARPDQDAATLPLQVLKVVWSELAKGNRQGRLFALVVVPKDVFSCSSAE